MSQAIHDLMHEHDAIRFTLKVLDKMALRAQTAQALDAQDARGIIAFLREFADKCHHGKEEGILFPAMEEAGVARGGGPIGEMLSEHERGRELIAAMEEGLGREGELAAFAAAAREYASLLRAHIDKENMILFPLAENLLGEKKLARIFERFEEHEEKVIGAGRHEQLHAMLDGFERTYLGAGA